ncbi:hypothetical protein GLAREA_06174 [Glarea lozoyensis ATCC 20868]|uniref:Uncharacterized protein n=1 Tax=Glarea lozoyensis (strain ATCC 20868 / MF5171) TaxID=1116229 RepID=S3D3W1_GLAL2|nr:uncharacterized protein GLAREA_06174 [Glarea lozoyensis ATCC 20868]EPE33162.1 hypothetical protein GLAREA_06174 [Glarea lozoyensis ATCC 20868]
MNKTTAPAPDFALLDQLANENPSYKLTNGPNNSCSLIRDDGFGSKSDDKFSFIRDANGKFKLVKDIGRDKMGNIVYEVVPTPQREKGHFAGGGNSLQERFGGMRGGGRGGGQSSLQERFGGMRVSSGLEGTGRDRGQSSRGGRGGQFGQRSMNKNRGPAPIREGPRSQPKEVVGLGIFLPDGTLVTGLQRSDDTLLGLRMPFQGQRIMVATRFNRSMGVPM